MDSKQQEIAALERRLAALKGEPSSKASAPMVRIPTRYVVVVGLVGLVVAAASYFGSERTTAPDPVASAALTATYSMTSAEKADYVMACGAALVDAEAVYPAAKGTKMLPPWTVDVIRSGPEPVVRCKVDVSNYGEGYAAVRVPCVDQNQSRCRQLVALRLGSRQVVGSQADLRF